MTGELLGSTYVGSNPTVVALSDDGDVAYVALDGSGAVRRVDLTTDTAGLEFAVGTSTHYGTLFAEDIAILPGQTETVVIATYRKGVSPRHGGVFVYDDGVRRPSGTRDHTGSNRIEAVDATSLVGYNNGSTEFGLRRLVVSATGITETQVQRDVLTGFSTDIHMIGSRLFSTQGRVADPVNLTLLGTLPVNGALCGDATGDHVYVATGSSSYPYDSGAVTVFDAATLQQVSTLPLGGNAARLLLRMSDDQIVLVREGSVQIIQSRLFDTSVAR